VQCGGEFGLPRVVIWSLFDDLDLVAAEELVDGGAWDDLRE
jgi:hypothetical protein